MSYLRLTLEADEQPCRSTDPDLAAEPDGISSGTVHQSIRSRAENARKREGESIFLL